VVVYWDTSALVAILGRAPQASHYRGIARQYGVVTWWGTYVECVSAIARRAREGNAPTQVAEAYRMLDEMANARGRAKRTAAAGSCARPQTAHP